MESINHPEIIHLISKLHQTDYFKNIGSLSCIPMSIELLLGLLGRFPKRFFREMKDYNIEEYKNK